MKNKKEETKVPNIEVKITEEERNKKVKVKGLYSIKISKYFFNNDFVILILKDLLNMK